MPNLLVPIGPTTESITHHAMHGMITQVMKLTGISSKTPRYILNDDESIALPGTSMLDQQQTKLGHDERLNVSYLEEYIETSVINSAVRHDEESFIFVDQSLSTSIKPIYSYTEVTLNFNYRTESRHQAEKWRNDIKVRLADDRQSQLFELDFHYPIPVSVLVILLEIHKARELKSGYGETLSKYLKDKFTPRATTLVNQVGKRELLVIRESQVGIQGWHESILPPVAERNDGGGAYVVNFSYKFHYHKPVSLHFVYPQMVHNTILPARFLNTGGQYTLEERKRLPGLYYAAFEDAYGVRVDTNGPLGGVRIPKWDEWLPRAIPSALATLVTMFVGIEQENLYHIAELSDIGEYEWHPAFKSFFKKEAPWVTKKKGESFIHLHLYEGRDSVTHGSMTLDQDLKVDYLLPLDIREMYHLSVSLVIEYSLLTERAKKAMSDNGLIILYLFKQLDKNFDIGKAKDWLVNGWLPPGYIQEFLDRLKDKNNWGNGGNRNPGSNIGRGNDRKPIGSSDNSGNVIWQGYDPDNNSEYRNYLGEGHLDKRHVNYLTILGTRGKKEWLL